MAYVEIEMFKVECLELVKKQTKKQTTSELIRKETARWKNIFAILYTYLYIYIFYVLCSFGLLLIPQPQRIKQNHRRHTEKDQKKVYESS